MAVVLVQNGVHSWAKSHFMHDEVGNDVSSGPSSRQDDPVFAAWEQPEIFVQEIRVAVKSLR